MFSLVLSLSVRNVLVEHTIPSYLLLIFCAVALEIFTFLRSVFCHDRWCSWLRDFVTRRKVAGSIPDSLIKIFH